MKNLLAIMLLAVSSVCFAQLGTLQHRRGAFRDYTESLVLWLRADANVATTGTWVDKSGEGNDCALFNDAYVTKGIGLILDGTGDYGTVAQAAELEFGVNDFSISYWAKSAALGSAQTAVSYGDRGSASGNDTGIALFAETAGKAGAYCKNPTDGHFSVISTSTATDNTWHHVAVTFDRDGNASIYVDNAAAENTSSLVGIGSFDTDLRDDWEVGRRWHDAADTLYLNGTLDDIRIYSVALTQEHVGIIYAAGLH